MYENVYMYDLQYHGQNCKLTLGRGLLTFNAVFERTDTKNIEKYWDNVFSDIETTYGQLEATNNEKRYEFSSDDYDVIIEEIDNTVKILVDVSITKY